MSKPKLKPMSLTEQARKILENSAEFNADFGSLLYQLEQLRAMCTAGIGNQKVSTINPQPVTVYEVFPSVAKACILGKLTVLEAAYKIAQDESGISDEPFQVNINLLADPRGEKPSELE